MTRLIIPHPGHFAALKDLVEAKEVEEAAKGIGAEKVFCSKFVECVVQ